MWEKKQLRKNLSSLLKDKTYLNLKKTSFTLTAFLKGPEIKAKTCNS